MLYIIALFCEGFTRVEMDAYVLFRGKENEGKGKGRNCNSIKASFIKTQLRDKSLACILFPSPLFPLAYKN